MCGFVFERIKYVSSSTGLCINKTQSDQYPQNGEVEPGPKGCKQMNVGHPRRLARNPFCGSLWPAIRAVVRSEMGQRVGVD